MKVVQVSAIDATMNGLLGELNKQTVEAGHELICVCSDGPRVEEMRDKGYDVRPIHIDRSIKPISNIKSIWKMFKLFRKERPDIVHVHTPVAAVLGRIAAKFARVPTVIYTAHGFYFHENMSKRTYRFFYMVEKVSAKLFTDYIFTQSEEDGALAVEKKFLPEDRITVISNGVDVTNKFNPSNIDQNQVKKLKENLGINEKDQVITFIGRLVKEKGIFELLDAFRHLDRDNVKLLIIGDTGESERDQNTKAELEKYIHDKNVTFTGFRKDIPELLSITDIFCLPSYREGMPRSIIEAMAMECAIVATDIRGSREEVDHEENGLLVPLKSVKPLSEAFNTILNDSKVLNTYRVNAREKAVSLYNEDTVVKTQLAIIEQTIK